jgi:putative phosphoribosyl transferase
LIATVKMIKKSNPKKIIVAVPVAPPETALRFKNFVDEFVCLLTPFDFLGVGQFYEDFTQVSDEEVTVLLNKSREKNVTH